MSREPRTPSLPSRPSTGFRRALALLGVAALGTLGCAFGEFYPNDPLLRQASLADIQQHYTALVRWSAFAKAARYVEPEARDDFMALQPPFKDFRFTDYESGPVDIDDETGEATVQVTYYGYRMDSPFEVEVRETQHWKRDSIANDWQVTPKFEGLEAGGLASQR